MNYGILLITSLLFLSNELLSQDKKPDKISKLEVKLDSIVKLVMSNKQELEPRYYAHYSLTNTSKDPIVFVSNSCPSANKYSIEINGCLYSFNSNVLCTMNSFTFDTIAPAKSIQISDILHSNAEIKFSENEILTFSIPLKEWESGEIQVNGLANDSNNITFIGKAKLISKYVDNKKKKKRQTIAEKS
jgi:hypothetical protein